MGQADYLLRGDWNAVCYVCGRKFKASALKRHWKGYYVCEADWEPRHPQDFVRAVRDDPSTPWSQPEPADTFIGVCTPNGLTAIAWYAVAGCVISGYQSPMFDPSVSAGGSAVVPSPSAIPGYMIPGQGIPSNTTLY